MGVAKTCISEICEKEHELKAFGMLNGMWGLGKSLQIDRKITTEESCEQHEQMSRQRNSAAKVSN